MPKASPIQTIRFPTNVLRARAEKLADDPKEVHQSPFGICGMTSVMYVLIHKSKARFIELLAELFGNGIDVSSPSTTPGDPKALAQLMKWYAKVNPKGVEKEYQLDFLVSRYLGILLQRNNAKLYGEQEKFTRELAGNGAADSTDLAAGNLALNFDGLGWMANRELLSGRVHAVHAAAGTPIELPELAKELKTRFVIAAQNLTDNDPPYYNHWVVLLDLKPKGDGWSVVEWSRGSVVDYGHKLSSAEVAQIYPCVMVTGVRR